MDLSSLSIGRVKISQLFFRKKKLTHLIEVHTDHREGGRGWGTEGRVVDDTRGRLHLTRLLTLNDAVIGHHENTVVVTRNQALHVAMFIVCDIPTVLHCLDLLAIPFMETLKTERNI